MLRCARALAAGLGLVVLAACAVSPEPRDRIAEIGRVEHPRVLQRFGGAVTEPRLNAYVAAIGAKLERAIGRSDAPIAYTILDEPTPNAFSLPGDHVYVTRGLLAIIDDEAELAATIAHEIAHLEADHAVARLDLDRRQRAGGTLRDIIEQPPARDPPRGMAALPRSAAPLLFQQELDADRLGVTYLAAAGYDPTAMARTLRRLAQYDHLHRELTGLPALAAANRLDQRIRAVEQQAARLTAAVGDAAPRAQLLALLDGVAWGPTVRRGFLRGRTFVHPGLGVRFALPPAVEVASGEAWVVARDLSGLLILADARKRSPGRAGEPQAMGAASLSVDTPRGERHVRFLKPGGFNAADRHAIRVVSETLQPLSPDLIATLRQREIAVIEVGASDTVASLATELALPNAQEAFFRLINGLEPDDEVVPGRLMKSLRWRPLSLR